MLPVASPAKSLLLSVGSDDEGNNSDDDNKMKNPFLWSSSSYNI